MNLGEDIRKGLSSAPKRLPSALFYDALGSRLFEVITQLPEYPLFSAGLRVIREHADAMVAVPGPVDLVELGPGGGAQARILAEALARRQERVRFVGIDVSEEALAACLRLLGELPSVSAEAIQGDYLEGLRKAARMRRPGTRLLVAFLGSSISNLERDEARRFLAAVGAALSPGDSFLLAADLDKPPAQLLPAYDDALGVTAAFNKNALLRLNREWGADFDLGAFSHEARWNPSARRIEMHLRSLRDQEVRIPELDLKVALAEGETIWTESSHRFRVEELQSWAREAGLSWSEHWIDAEWPFVTCRMQA